MAANDIWEVVLRGRFGSGQIASYSVFHFKEGSGAAISTVPQAILDLIDSNGVDGILPNSMVYTEASYAKISPAPRGPQIIVGVTKAMSGSDTYVPQCASVVKCITATGGRSARGRTYLGPIIEGEMDKGVLSSGAQGALKDWADAMVAKWGVGGTNVSEFTMGIWSRKLSLFYPITAAARRTTVYTQRRRVAGVGI